MLVEWLTVPRSDVKGISKEEFWQQFPLLVEELGLSIKAGSQLINCSKFTFIGWRDGKNAPPCPKDRQIIIDELTRMVLERRKRIDRESRI